MRVRFRDLGFAIGRLPTGSGNAITDVPGVRVGHTTIIAGHGPRIPGRGPVRTGVTAILPPEPIFDERPLAGSFVLNGAGEISGFLQVREWGMLETPVLLCSTMSVGRVSDAVVEWMTGRFPGIGDEHEAIIPVVGECDDSWLSDAVGRHIRTEHVIQAIEGAASGPVAEGSVGGGTGLVTCDFKAGIGTSSRWLSPDEIGVGSGGYTVGALVQTNFGLMRSLCVAGVPVGEILAAEYAALSTRIRNGGSIIVVLATDAPLLPQQLSRLCKRAALGIGRAGSFAAHASGEILLAFSTKNRVPRRMSGVLRTLEVLTDDACDALFEAAGEATEEAIVNALCMAETTIGRDGHEAPALPLERVADILRDHRVATCARP